MRIIALYLKASPNLIKAFISLLTKLQLASLCQRMPVQCLRPCLPLSTALPAFPWKACAGLPAATGLTVRLSRGVTQTSMYPEIQPSYLQVI